MAYDKPPDGSQAFPGAGLSGTRGMTYRQWLVGQALKGSSSDGLNQVGAKRRAAAAVLIADRCIELLSMGEDRLETELKEMM